MIATFKFILDPRGFMQQFITGEPRGNEFSHSSSTAPGPHSVAQRKTEMQQVLWTRGDAEEEETIILPLHSRAMLLLQL